MFRRDNCHSRMVIKWFKTKVRPLFHVAGTERNVEICRNKYNNPNNYFNLVKHITNNTEHAFD